MIAFGNFTKFIKDGNVVDQYVTMIAVQSKDFSLARKIAMAIPLVSALVKRDFKESELTPAFLNELLTKEEHAVVTKDDGLFKIDSKIEQIAWIAYKHWSSKTPEHALNAKDELGKFYDLVKSIVDHAEPNTDFKLSDKALNLNPELVFVYEIMLDMIQKNIITEWF